jgi:hypothetical protein
MICLHLLRVLDSTPTEFSPACSAASSEQWLLSKATARSDPGEVDSIQSVFVASLPPHSGTWIWEGAGTARSTVDMTNTKKCVRCGSNTFAEAHGRLAELVGMENAITRLCRGMRLHRAGFSKMGGLDSKTRDSIQ